ncbi:hypothetical protein P154DRAFT_624273 [Amniculicola lignicola CBS 123094]|uniref:Uncharacterized protein n=1 Tax=Amniculicola lignicola CBS 123094 TaxID=1392246 RepID=A0A6A5W1Y3_9PLEO|nr:hypothetical protein P154DRAFT_624273 [Amniculicola lignicola CBS 123094]
MSSSKRVFSPQTLQKIADLGGHVSSVERGYRNISTPYISPPSSRSSPGTLEANKSSLTRFPEVLESAQTLELLGYTASKAEFFWNRFLQLKDEDFESFLLNLITYHSGDADSIGDDWRAVMSSMGISPALQESVMNEKFTDIRMTQPLKKWLVEILRMNFAALMHLDGTVNRMISKGEGDTVNLRGGAGNDEEAEAEVRGLVSPEQVPEGHVVLWKGITRERLTSRGFFEQQPRSVNFLAVVSEGLSDFSSARSVLYFTPQYEIAAPYAQYVESLAIVENATCILQLFVPNDFLNSLKTRRMEFGPDWKELVWTSRKGREYPDSWFKDYSRQEVIVGPISKGAKAGWSRMKNWKDISRDNVLHLANGEMGTQLVFMKDRHRRLLAAAVENKIHLYNYNLGTKYADPWDQEELEGMKEELTDIIGVALPPAVAVFAAEFAHGASSLFEAGTVIAREDFGWPGGGRGHGGTDEDEDGGGGEFHLESACVVNKRLG